MCEVCALSQVKALVTFRLMAVGLRFALHAHDQARAGGSARLLVNAGYVGLQLPSRDAQFVGDLLVLVLRQHEGGEHLLLSLCQAAFAGQLSHELFRRRGGFFPGSRGFLGGLAREHEEAAPHHGKHQHREQGERAGQDGHQR